mmetsp:Transcript_22009/g.75479  ORF Transcript_22009/g.75479 Transcript_22009/m.75479 type:complete len:257 (+) Transcript_22009:292-1062(+)
MVFGISNAMIFVSMRQALRCQRLVPRSVVAHVAAWSTAVEVSIITLQAWRGVPSHFNKSTPLDASLYAIKLCGVSVLGVTCFLAAAGVVAQPVSANRVQLSALRHGMALMCLAALVGFGQVVYGHAPRAPTTADEYARCLAATAGAVAGPCYEIHGKAIVKLAHFLPLHATEVLLLLTWAIDHASVRDGHVLLHVAAAGCWSISIIGLWQTFIGEDLRSPGLHVGVAVLFSLGCVPIAFLRVLFAPLSGGKHGHQH